MSQQVIVPIPAVKGIYARESGQGMMFQDEPGAGGTNAEADSDQARESNDGDDDDTRPPRNRGGLRVVK